MSQQYSTFHNEPLPLPYLVVNQQPPQLSHFPISFSFNTAFILGILKCAIGFVEFVLGVVNIFAVDYFTSFIAVPIWCGLTIWINGLFGIILKWKRTKCLIAAFLALSISSLILTLLMLVFYSVTLNYVIEGGYQICSYGYHPTWQYYCVSFLSESQQSTGKGLIGFLVFLILCELGCSIGSVFISCRAYSKFCSTCNANDCCTCLGCCECDTQPLGSQQDAQQQSGSHSYTNFSEQRGPQSQCGGNGYRVQWQPPSNARGTNAADYDTPSATNPCSALVNIFVQMPGGSQLISSLQNGAGVTTPQNLIIQPCPTNEQGENVLQPQQQAGMTQA